MIFAFKLILPTNVQLYQLSFRICFSIPYFQSDSLCFIRYASYKLHRAEFFYIQSNDVTVIYYYIKNYPKTQWYKQ